MEAQNKGGALQVYLDIAKELKGRIFEGELAEGQRLPGENELAENFGVNRLTVRKALDKLAKESLIKTIKGKGSYVQRNPGRTKTIAILSGGPEPLQSATMRSVACAATIALKNKGFIITLELTKDLDALIAAHHAAERQLSGILALRTAINEDPSVAETLASIDIPVVAEGTDAVDFDKVMIDNKKAMEQAIEYLWSLGHRRIGLLKVDDSDKGDLPVRISCAVEELKKRDAFREDFVCTVRDNVFGPLFDDPDMNGFLAREERPSALICMSDCLAVNMLVIAQRRGLRVPEDLSLIGFDNQDAGKFSQPSLTSFENDYAALGVAAAKLLMERMENYSNRKRRLLLEQKFHIRNSCASPKS